MTRWIYLALAAAGCGGNDARTPPPETKAGDFIDLNADPNVVEVNLAAAQSDVEILPGKPTTVWGYRDGANPDARGSLPGPMLDVHQGQEVVVTFANHLEIETTIHWHGIRLDPSMDGSNLSQAPVAPGETFTYRFVALDPGFYWYHPHLRADEQIEAGLQAPLIVRGGTEPDVTAERYFVLDDIKLESTGALSRVITALDLMVGRQGNVRLVNGKRAPVTLETTAGGRERWHFVNTANGHFFNLVVPGTPLLVIGWDGGLVTEPYEVDRLVIAPGERYDVIVEPGVQLGDSIVLQDVHYDRGHNLPDEGPKDLVTFVTSASLDGSLEPLPTTWGDFEPIDVSEARTRTFALTEAANDDDPSGEPEFFINDEKWPAVTPTVVELGTTEIWEIANDSEMDHPIHLHGMFFQALDVAGVPSPPIGLKDTFIVPQGRSSRFAVTYDAAGDWMYHCHILEHAERGMMGHLHVLE
jgi:FtsP/CotA-like multicopper oxidase with cupredoxin domain